MVKTSRLNERVVYQENNMVDCMDSMDWEEAEDELAELRTPVIHMHGGSRKRETHACEVQALAVLHMAD